MLDRNSDSRSMIEPHITNFVSSSSCSRGRSYDRHILIHLKHTDSESCTTFCNFQRRLRVARNMLIEMAEPSKPASSSPLSEDNTARVLEFHDIQLRYKLSQTTLKTLCAIPPSPDRRTILERACSAAEFRSFPLKQVEKPFFREINENKPIPYLLREAVTQPWHKVFLLVQIDLLKTGWPNKISAAARKELYQERGRIYNVLDRVLRCLVDIFGRRLDGRGTSVALDVLRSVKAGVWEGNSTELLQVEGIGAVKMDKLVQAGVRNIRQLSKMEFYHIERLLSRNPPFGQQMLRQLAGFPLLKLKVDIVQQLKDSECSVASSTGLRELSNAWVARVTVGYDNMTTPHWNKKRPWTTLVVEGADGRLVWFWRGSVRRFDQAKDMLVCLEAKKGEELKVSFACEEIVGTMLRETFRL